MKRRGRKGAALIVVLLLAATLSLVALSISELMSRSAERSTGLRARNEALWVGYGVEQLTLAAVRAGLAASPKRLTAAAPWIDRPLTFPLEQGSATVVVTDATRCIDLNSLVAVKEDGRSAPSKSGAAVVSAFLAAARPEGFSGESALVGAATDWIDADIFNEPQGAEDGVYLSEKIPRRTGGTFFADPTELRAVRGMPQQAFGPLRRMLCARTGAAQTPLNVNMLRDEDAAVLVGLSEGAISIAEARSVIADRPPGGYETLDEFWSHPVLKERKFGGAVRARTGLASRYLEARAVINHGGRTLDLTLTIETSQSGKARIVRRRLGPVE